MNKETRKEHYIPRFILRNHSLDDKRQRVYKFDKLNNEENAASIKNTSYKDYLYEFRNEKGEIINKNIIENTLHVLETKRSDIINKKIKKKEDLSEDDIACLYLLTGIQILRTPEVMQTSKEFLEKYTDIDGYLLDNCVRMFSLICSGFTIDNNIFLNAILKYLCDKSFTVLRSDNVFILNEKRPVLHLKDCSDIFLFPVDKYNCLSFSNGNYRNQYIIVDEDIVNYVNKNNFDNDSRFIYSSRSILI